MTSFTAKSTGVYINSEELIFNLKTLAENNGFTVELYDDNIIDSVNRGKRLHLSKDGLFYNFVSVSDISPIKNSSDDAKYISNNISSLSCNISTGFNPLNDWFNNTGASSNNTNNLSIGNIRSCELNDNSKYWIYINDKSIVIISKFNATNYSMLVTGKLSSFNPLDNCFIVTGSSNTYNDFNSIDNILENRTPFASVNTANHSTFILNNVNLDNNRLYENHYTSSGYYPIFTIDKITGKGLINRSDNIFNGTSLLFPIEYYKRDSLNGNMSPIASVDNIFIVNMKNHLPENEFNIGLNQYIVFPFNRKYSPHSYNNNGFGLGIAIKVGG